MGGVLTVVRSEVELMVTAGDIPEKITVDLAGLEMNGVIHIADVTLPQGAKPRSTATSSSPTSPHRAALRAADSDDEGEDAEPEA